MTPDQRFLAIGIYITSALYLTGCWASGILTGNPWAWKSALAGVGFAYISYYAQLLQPAQSGTVRWVAVATVGLSIVFGVAAGLALLVR